MKYTIELTNKQKAQMDCIIDIVHRYVGFNPKLEPMENINEYQIGYNEGLAKQSDPHFVPLQKCPVRLEDCKAYKLGIEDLAHAMKVYGPLNSRERLDYFGLNIHVDNYAIVNPEDLITKAKAYEEKKNTIECGDEVTILESGITGVVLAIKGDVYEILSSDAKWNKLLEDQIEKTGRNLKDEVLQLLDKLGGENNV